MLKTWADFNITVPNTGGGAERYTTCPQCSNDRKRSNKRKACLSVNVDKQVWFCNHCGWAGTLKSGSHKQYQGDNLHWKKPDWIRPDYKPDGEIKADWLQWFIDRGITEEVLKRNRITTAAAYMPQLEDWTTCTLFPFYRDGACINIKYRDREKNFRLQGGAERIFFGLDDVDETTIIVEGEIDKLSMEMAGFENCISVPDGAPDPKTREYSSKFSFLESSKEKLDKVKQFILAVDNDEAGIRLETELMHRLGRDRCSLVKWPPGCKDANEVLLKCGMKTLVDVVYNAEPPPVEGVIRISDVMDRLRDFYYHGRRPGVSPGWDAMEEFFLISPGELTVVTGIPGHGKSEWLDALVMNLATRHGWGTAYYSPENFPVEEHIAKITEKKTGKPFSHPSPLLKLTADELEESSRWLNDHFFFLQLEEENLSIETIIENSKALVFRHGIKVLVIDPWNEVEHNRPQHLTETDYTSLQLTKLRRFARSAGIAVFLVAHPVKLQKDSKGVYPVPTPYDISGSSHWHNKPDNCIAVYRDKAKPKEPVQVHFQKIKFKKNGKVGVCYFKYDTMTGRYTDIPDHF
jgi:twinkle protein